MTESYDVTYNSTIPLSVASHAINIPACVSGTYFFELSDVWNSFWQKYIDELIATELLQYWI